MTNTASSSPVEAALPLQPPHAFHRHLPPHHRHPSVGDSGSPAEEGVPYVTGIAHRKARKIVELAHSLCLTESLFLERGDVGGVNAAGVSGATAEATTDATQDGDVADMDVDVEDLDVEDGDDDEVDVDLDDDEVPEGDGSRPLPAGAVPMPSETLQSFTKKLSRLQAQLTGLEALKYGGITQIELCHIVLHLLKLVTCTIEHQPATAPPNEGDGSESEGGGGDSRGSTVTLRFENVGYLWQGREQPMDPEPDLADAARQLERPFALHSPAREMLLLILINILSNKGPLRSVSNAAIYPSDDDSGASPQRSLLILHWKALLRTLLRTAPYLDEKRTAHVRSDSNYRQTTVLKRTVQLIRDARHFFDQGLRPPRGVVKPSGNDGNVSPSPPPALNHAARQVWDLVKTDILYHSHTHACYRGTILLYLFHPSRCTSLYYLEVMPLWWSSWTNIDRCPEYDFLYLACFCRARKHIAPDQYDWGPIRRRLLTHAQYWLQLPIGGAAMDKSFPRAPNPRSRSCPPRLKVFTGSASSYEEGIDFVAKVVKLLVTGLGTGPPVQGSTAAKPLSEGTHDLLRFLSFATPYFNPSNIGSWTFTLGAFLHYFAYELSCRVGAAAGTRTLRRTHPGAAQALADAQPGAALDIPAAEVVALLDVLLPLCQQAIYSKNPHVGRAGEAALLYLVQIDPARATPSFVDFAVRALDVQAVNLSHQAPSALSALTRLVQPALRCDPSVLLLRLPDLLSLSLAGIDSNDQNKTIRTLILYRSLTSWLPVGSNPEAWPWIPIAGSDSGSMPPPDGTVRLASNLMQDLVAMRECDEYREAIASLPETSLLKLGSRDDAQDPDMQRLALEEASSALSDWAVEFLERVFGLLRASGEREKAAKTASGVATRHSSADVHQARNFSRVLIECLMQLFASMDAEVHEQSVRSLVRFLHDETHPSAAKDASLVCQAAAAARTTTSSPGMDALVPVLTTDLHRHSTKCAIYRVRCLAGSVRWAGKAVLAHRASISSAIDFALASDDRHLFKTGCKLLRHMLSTLTESYPLSTDSSPRLFRDSAGSLVLGRSGQLSGDPITWHVPDGDCISFAAELLDIHVSRRLQSLCSESPDGSSSRLLQSTDVNELRRCLRVIRYSIRGAATILLDDGLDPSNDDVVAYEIASFRLIESGGQKVQHALLQLRGRLSTFLIVLNSIIASDTLYPDGFSSLPDNEPTQKALTLVSADPKVCKETCDLALLLLTRRGAMFRSQEARTIWKAQKQVSADFTLCSQVDRIAEALQSADLFGSNAALLYKDGEDAGKTLPRRLVVARVQLFHTSLQRNASFEVPRRLRRVEREENPSREILFCVKSTLPESIVYLQRLLRAENHRPLDAYDGIIDGLFALCCHSNTQVRASAISVVDYAMTRFGWIVAPRVPRMLSALSLQDSRMNGKFGVPSCALLVDHLNHQGKRKRLAEAVKGVCSILSLTRAVRQMLGSWKMRHRFVETLCGTDLLVSLLPAEEMQKIIHYLQTVFSPFRSSFYMKPRTSASEIEYHERSISFVLEILSEKKTDAGPGDLSEAESVERKSAHWRKLLLASWFLLVFVDEGDVKGPPTSHSQRLWDTCFFVLENNFGQPLQRVALGLFGKLICLLDKSSDVSILQSKMGTESFCKVLGKALVYDHREDTSVGGGHDAQWSSGVETIIRDASRHVAPRTLFPFQRTSQSLGSFKVPHSQFLELLLTILDEGTAVSASHHLLAFARELTASPPSEDQRNQQITAAEIYAGVCGSFLRSSRLSPELWSSLLMPFLEDALSKTPFSLCGAYFDAIRYALQFAPPESYFPMTEWLIDKVKSTLWQPNESAPDDVGERNGSSQGTEGFTAQSKWLYLFSAVLIEMDETESDDVYTKPARFVQNLLAGGSQSMDCSDAQVECDMLETSWKLVTESLLLRLTEALGHPFDSCRDHISRCLFRICYSHRKMARMSASKAPSRSSSAFELAAAATDTKDPGWIIVDRLSSLSNDASLSYKSRFNSLITARRFVSNCVHLGEAKFEFSDYVIPLLSLAFISLDVTSDDNDTSGPPEATAVVAATPPNNNTNSNDDSSAARRALEAEVVKGFRGMISEVSVTAVISYGSDLDISRVLDAVEGACRHDKWQVRHAGINFLRCFQGAHKFVFRPEHADQTMSVVIELLADERREVSSAAMAALTGILAATPADDVARMVRKYAKLADGSKVRRPRKGGASVAKALVAAASTESADSSDAIAVQEKKRQRNQQVSVFFLCATVMSRPYDTPSYVPIALAAISRHSFEKSAPLSVRDTVKRCCAEYKRTHMSDNWDEHRRCFSQEQLEALEDVVSTPHYYA